MSSWYSVVREQHDSTAGRTPCELLLLRLALSALLPRETVGSKAVRVGSDSVISAKSVSGTCDYTRTPTRVYARVFRCTVDGDTRREFQRRHRRKKEGKGDDGAKRGKIKQICSGMDTRVENLLVHMIRLRISLFKITSQEITDDLHLHRHLRAQTLHLR